MRRRRYLDQASVEIRKASNGYMVRLPEVEGDDYGDMPRYDTAQDDFRKKIFDKKFWYEIMTVFQKAKAGEPLPELPEEPPRMPEPMPELPEPENNLYVFPTWKEASDFINDFYSKQ